MLGRRALPMLSAKAVETKGILHFILDMLVQHVDRLGPATQHLLEAGGEIEWRPVQCLSYRRANNRAGQHVCLHPAL